ncbi:MAG: zinc ribbon domain-containing protein [Tepidimonas sp.]|uniref:zinc ribbon domain-containing protein n=1 Tax=Tepidimonas sp. TaxID=2002775 RepID=UPI0040552D34
MAMRTANHLGVLMRSFEALHNWRALAMLAGSFVLGVLAIIGGAAAGMSSGSVAVMTLMGLLGGILVVIGMNASGLMLLDQAYDQPIRGFGPAFLGGVQSALYVTGQFMVLSLGFGVVLLAVFLLSLLGRIPGVGGLIGFVLAGPLVVVVALAFVVLLLAWPLMIAAVWHGEGFFGSLLRAVGIVMKRPLEVFMHFLVLGLLLYPAAALILSAMLVGSALVGGFFFSGRLVGLGLVLVGMLDLDNIAWVGMGGAGLSIGLVWLLALSVVSLIFVLGMIFVYRAVSEGVSSEASDVLAQKLAQFKQKFDEYKPRPVPMAPPVAAASPKQPRIAQARADQPPAPPTPPDAPMHCPACGAVVQPEDLFCGSCGHKLKQLPHPA